MFSGDATRVSSNEMPGLARQLGVGDSSLSGIAVRAIDVYVSSSTRLRVFEGLCAWLHGERVNGDYRSRGRWGGVCDRTEIAKLAIFLLWDAAARR